MHGGGVAAQASVGEQLQADPPQSMPGGIDPGARIGKRHFVAGDHKSVHSDREVLADLDHGLDLVAEAGPRAVS